MGIQAVVEREVLPVAIVADENHARDRAEAVPVVPRDLRHAEQPDEGRWIVGSAPALPTTGPAQHCLQVLWKRHPNDAFAIHKFGVDSPWAALPLVALQQRDEVSYVRR